MKRMFRLVVLAILVSANTLLLRATVYELPNKLVIEIPDDYKLKSNTESVYRWTNADGREMIFVTACDSVSYDLDKCKEQYDRVALNLSSYASYDEESEKIWDLRHDWVERYFYHTVNKSRLITHTGYTVDKPYVFAFTYKEGESLELFHEITKTIVYRGTWWERMRLLMKSSFDMLFFFTVMVFWVAYITTLWLPSRCAFIVAAMGLIVLGVLLGKEIDTALPVYLVWGLLLAVFKLVDYRDFFDICGKIEKNVP